MKIHVSDIQQHGSRVYVEGIRKVQIDGKWTNRCVSTSFPYEYWKENVKQLKFPIVLDVSFVKGVGARLNGQKV